MTGRPTPLTPAVRLALAIAASGVVALLAGVLLDRPPTPSGPAVAGRAARGVYQAPTGRRPPRAPSPANARLHGPRAGDGRGVASRDFPHAGAPPQPAAGAAGATVLQRLPLTAPGLRATLTGTAARPSVLVAHRSPLALAVADWQTLVARYDQPSASLHVTFRPHGLRALGSSGRAALDAARACAAAYAAYTLRQRPAVAVVPVTDTLADHLATSAPRVPARLRAARPRLDRATVLALDRTHARVATTFAGLALQPRLTVSLLRTPPGWACNQIGAAR